MLSGLLYESLRSFEEDDFKIIMTFYLMKKDWILSAMLLFLKKYILMRHILPSESAARIVNNIFFQNLDFETSFTRLMMRRISLEFF